MRNAVVLVLIGALAAHGLLWPALPLTVPLIVQSAAALLITGLLPGWLLAEWLVGGRAAVPLGLGERSVYSLGAGASVTVVGMLFLSYLPGPILPWQVLAAFDALTLALALLVWRRAAGAAQAGPGRTMPAPDAWPPLRLETGLAAGLLALALVAGFLRLPNLGYSEFQGDEATALLRTVEAIQGRDDALLLHLKGPGEVLLPAASYALLGRIDETTARLPFALVNLTGLFALFLLGLRLFGPVAGWSTAMLLALDGYFIGFARIVQYQSLVFCMAVLAVLAVYRLVRLPRLLPGYLLLAALFLTTGLLAHYEGALAGLPVAYLLWVLGRRVGAGRLARALAIPLALGAALLAAFYLPFVLHPNFRITYAYIAVNRIGVGSGGSSFPYNNLADVFDRTLLYSTSYYVALLVIATLWGLIGLYRRSLPAAWGRAVAALVVAGVALSVARPAWLQIGGQDHTWAFFALALVPAWFLPRLTVEERLAWLWFDVPLLAMLFFIRTPNTHVYGFFIGWALVAGSVIQAGWTALRARAGLRAATWAGAASALALTLLFGNYAYWYFVASDQEVLRTWRDNRPRGYWVPYTMPTALSIFGFPLQNGWKTLGVLYAEGALDAPFDTNGKPPVAEWYTRGQGYCPRDHDYFVWQQPVEPAAQADAQALRGQLEAEGYHLWGQVMVNAQPRLAIYQRASRPPAVQRFSAEAMAARFDAALSGPVFARAGPTAAPAIAHPLDFRFGDMIRLVGYTLAGQDAQPGDRVHLTLYWQATAPVAAAYSVFTQVIDPADAAKAGQRDGEPGCNLFPTPTWPPGDVIADRYSIPLAIDARPGTYRLLIGMYSRESGERLAIFSPNGDSLGDALGIDEVRVAAP